MTTTTITAAAYDAVTGHPAGCTCYWCHNAVRPSELPGTAGLAALYPAGVVAAKRAELEAAGQDPNNAAVLLRREGCVVTR